MLYSVSLASLLIFQVANYHLSILVNLNLKVIIPFRKGTSLMINHPALDLAQSSLWAAGSTGSIFRMRLRKVFTAFKAVRNFRNKN